MEGPTGGWSVEQPQREEIGAILVARCVTPSGVKRPPVFPLDELCQFCYVL